MTESMIKLGIEEFGLKVKLGKKIANFLTERGYSGESIFDASNLYFSHKPFNYRWTGDIIESVMQSTADVLNEYYLDVIEKNNKDVLESTADLVETSKAYNKILTDPNVLIDYVVTFFHPDEGGAYPVKNKEVYDKFEELAYCVLKDVENNVTPDELAPRTPNPPVDAL
jgi:hypothetical protein